MKVIAVIPCFNEKRTIVGVVSQTKQLVDACIVADDDSSDETAKEAQCAGAYIARHNGGRGAGVNTKTGIDVALVMGAEVVVTLDGDGQHDPLDIPRIVKPIVKGEADIVIGSRFMSKFLGMPKYRMFGISVITWLYNLGIKQKLTDGQCCFRAYSRNALGQMCIKERGFPFSVETLIKARMLGLQIRELPINVIYHTSHSQNSALSPLPHGLSVAWGTVRLRLKIELLDKIRHLFVTKGLHRM